MSNELRLTKLDRIVLVNQLRIMEALYPDEASQLSVQREVLERGYEMLYALDFENIYDGDDKMTPEESKEVWDTMDMFDAIDRSMPEGFDTSGYVMTKFGGYDGNNESKFMSFARFTVERLQRFEYLPMQRPGYWNSHMPVRDIYRRMLEVWKEAPSPERFSMPQEQLTRVLKAAVHPENR
jgi:uncharacterized protein YfbU (UPF0304 family)